MFLTPPTFFGKNLRNIWILNLGVNKNTKNMLYAGIVWSQITFFFIFLLSSFENLPPIHFSVYSYTSEPLALSPSLVIIGSG